MSSRQQSCAVVLAGAAVDFSDFTYSICEIELEAATKAEIAAVAAGVVHAE